LPNDTSEASGADARNTVLKRIAASVTGVLIVGAAVVTILGGWGDAWGVLRPDSRPPCAGGGATQAEIRTPDNDSAVPRSFEVAGRACGVRDGSTLWLVVTHAGLWWPQVGALSIAPKQGEARSAWSTSATAGKETDAGLLFDLVVVETTADADMRLRDWQKRGLETGYYPGITSDDPIRSGATAITSITVTRR
jgi:hypothetical protein